MKEKIRDHNPKNWHNDLIQAFPSEPDTVQIMSNYLQLLQEEVLPLIEKLDFFSDTADTLMEEFNLNSQMAKIYSYWFILQQAIKTKLSPKQENIPSQQEEEILSTLQQTKLLRGINNQRAALAAFQNTINTFLALL